jgi:topoisomerase-4 subunit B
MGKNTPDRQRHIISNLRIEKDTIEELISADLEAATGAVTEDIVEIGLSA